MLEIMLPFIVGKVKRLKLPICQVLLLVLWSSTGIESAFTKGDWYLGCYNDTALLTSDQDIYVPGNIADVDYGSSTDDVLARTCVSRCATGTTSYKYAWYSNRGMCLCSSKATLASALVAESSCNRQICNVTDDSSECDGLTFHRLFNTTGQLNAVKLLNNQLVKGLMVHNFTAETTPANFTGSQYQFDFGDGTISPWKPSSVFTYLFSKSGYYRATASAKTTPGITVSDDKVLQVLTPAYGVFFDVPVVFESSVATSYPIAVREGTNMTITVVSSSGTISAFSIADPELIQFGTTIGQLLTSSIILSNPNSGTYIMPRKTFPRKGLVSGFGIFISKAGSLRLQTFRPSCAAGKSYCVSSMTCTTSPCPTPDMLNVVNATSPSLGPKAPHDYKLVAEVTFQVDYTGYKYLKVKNKNMQVEAGDVLGFKVSANSADITHSATGSAVEYYYTNLPTAFPGDSFVSSGSTKKTTEHAIRVHLSAPSVVKKTDTFTKAGIETIKAEVTNDIGTHQDTKKVQVQHRIIELKVINLKSIAIGACPLDAMQTIDTTTTKGSNITYEWEIIRETPFTNFTYNVSKTLEFTPPTPGIYTLFVKGSNLINSDNDTVVFEVLEKVEKIIVHNKKDNRLSSPANKMLNVTVTVVKGTNVTLKAQFGSDPEKSVFISNASDSYNHTFQFAIKGCKTSTVKITADNRLILPKSEDVEVYLICPIKNLQITGKPAFSVTNGKHQANLKPKDELTLTVKIDQGSFVNYTFVTGVNGVQNQTKSHSTLITPISFSFTYKYDNAGTYHALISAVNSLSTEKFEFEVSVQTCPPPKLTTTGSRDEKNPTYVTRGEDYTVIGTVVKGNCTAAPSDYSATLYRIGNQTGLHTKTFAVGEDLKYSITRGSRPSGKYKITFTQVTNPNSQPTTVSLHSYVDIKQSNLVAVIKSGTSRIMPRKILDGTGNATMFYNVSLDGSGSYDPDDSSKKLTYEWYCKVSNATGLTPAQKQNLTCLDLNLTVITGSPSNSILINTRKYWHGREYEFVLVVTDGVRASNYTQKIEFILGNPPAVQFECVTNCGTKWNSQEKIIMKGRCPNCLDLESIRYKWELLDSLGKSVPNVDGNFDTSVTLTGWDKQSLVINAKQLNETTEYSLRLTAHYIESADKKTLMSLSKETSVIPKGGKCDLLPNTGTVAKTKYQVKCSGWQTIDKPIKYQFMTKPTSSAGSSASFEGSEDIPIWYAGSEPWNPANMLPMGDAKNNYTLQVIVRVYNIFGAYVELKPLSTKVGPVPPSKSGAENAAKAAITASEPTSKDSAGLSQWAASAASILNAETVNEKSNTATTEEKDNAKNELEEITKVRTQVISSLSSADMKDISLPNLKQLGDSLSSVTSKTDQLSEEAQEVGAAFLTKMAESLAATDSRSGADMLQQTSLAIMGPLSNLMDATTQNSESYLTDYSKEGSQDSTMTTVSPTRGMTTKSTPTRKAQIIAKAEQTRKKVESYMKTLSLVSERLLKNKVVGESSMVTKTKSFEIALEKKNYGKLANATFNTGDSSLGVTLPHLKALKEGVKRNGSELQPQDEVSCQTTVMNKILHTWDIPNAQNSASAIQSLELRSDSYESLTVKDLTSPISITVKNREEKLNFTKIKLSYPEEMKIVQQQVKSLNTPLLVQFDSPDNSPSNLTVLIQFGQAPSKTQYDIKLDITNQGIDVSKKTGNVTNPSNSTSRTSSSPTPLTRNSNIRVIDSKTIIMWDFNNFTYGNLGNRDLFFNFYYHGAMPDQLFIPNQFTFDLLEVPTYRNYTMRTFSCSCLFWSEDKNKWLGSGCKVDTELTDFNKTVCKCTHLTSFGGFFVKPNPIPPLTADMFLQGYVVFVCVSSALLLFVIGLVFARRADKRDIHKVGVCPLADNKPENHYLYEITVWTGMRRGAATESNVYFILSGDLGDTEIRHLKDPDRPTFQRSSSDVFVFSTEHALGDLSHIRIWHDNSGGGWYLRKVVVMDLQTDKTFQFLCNRWLAVDQDDGQVEMVAPVSGKEELKDFNYVFMTKTRNDLTDSHLWFSVYARPPRSPFTRVQRLACCMSLLMTSMLASAMFYKQAPKPTPQTANYVAGLQFTWKQVYVAIISCAITVPINIIIVTIFRSSKPKNNLKISKVSPSRTASRADIADNSSVKSAESSSIGHSESPQFNMNQNSDIPLLDRKPKKEPKSVKVKIDAEEKKAAKERKAPKEPFLFPHWCIYIAWFLTFASIIASSVVVIIYGMVFANSKSWEWISSITISLVSDILIIQPIKVFAVAVFFALIIRKVEDDQPNVEQHGKKLAQDEEWLHTYADTSLGTAVDTMTLRPPDDLKLDAMRTLRFKERKMGAISREILLYSLYVFITLTISYSLREEQGYWQTIDIEELFNLKVRTGAKFTVKTDQFKKVLSYNDFWPWAERVLVPSLFPDPWYQNTAYPTKTNQFPGKLYVNDLNHKLVNGVRIRQVRVKRNSCKKPDDVKDAIKIDCNGPYSFANEDQSSSIGNWSVKASTKPAITRVNQPWVYQTWSQLDSYPFLAELTTYYGGGYTLDLFPRFPNIKNLQDLKAKRWLDRHTRAVLIEFALFNPATNHFSVVTMVFEFAATGGCIHYHSVHTFKLYRYTTGYAFVTIVCEVLFLLLMLLYMYREFKEWYKLRAAYFTQFWNLIEISINLMSLVAIGFYFYREKLAKDLLKRLPSKQPDVFINFQFAAYCDQIFIYIVSLIVFFVSIKFIKLLRFNRRMSILSDTLKDAWYPLGMFSIVMGIVLFGSFAFGTIVFGVQMYSYRNLMVTASTQISLLLGKFNFYEYENTNRIIGPLFFFGYIIMVNWILMNMFVSIINDSFETVSNNISKQSNDYEIVDFVMDRFKEWVGFGKTRKSKIEKNIRWASAKAKISAMRAFSATSEVAKKSKWKNNEEELGGLAKSVYWHYTPTFDANVINRELDVQDVNKTVDRFIDCINLLYFDDVETAEKMSKKVKQEISDADFLEHEKSRELKP